jgi:AAA domain
MLKPRETREGDDFCFTWETEAIQFVLSGVREQHGDLSAIVRVNYVNGRAMSVFPASRLNLTAPLSRGQVAKGLSGRDPVPGMEADDWHEAVAYVCDRTYVLWEQGDPFVDLSVAQLPPWDRREVVRGFVPRADPLTLFSDGGVGKSTLAVALSLSVLTGRAVIPGLEPQAQGPVLYLDWESNTGEHGHRLHTLARHLGVALPAGFIYRRQFRALADDIGAVRREVARLRPLLCIVDSAVPASGDDVKETTAPARLFAGLRSLGELATLLLAHMSKAEAEKERGRARVIGSVMYENLSRSVWEARVSEAAGAEHVVGLYHRKFNGGRRREPFALRVRYDDDELPAGFERVDLRDYPDLEERVSPQTRLYDVLRHGPRTTAEVAEALGVSVAGARKQLTRYGMHAEGGGRGRGNAASWSLPDQAPLKPEDDRWWATENETP